MTAARALDDLWYLDGEVPGLDRPPAFATDERRLQVRAYNRWTGMLKGRSYPSVEDLRADPDNFGPNSVLLDFSAGPTNPKIIFLGDALCEECGLPDPLRSVADVPSRSLLSRLTDHYLQIIANRAPIGFEAEFVSQRGYNTLYRGILMPFSSDDVTIDYIFGAINWKELADHDTADGLVLEIAGALGEEAASRPAARDPLAPARAAPALASIAMDAGDEEFVLLLARRDRRDRLSVLARLPVEERLVESVARTLSRAG